MKEKIIAETSRLWLRAFEIKDTEAMTRVLCDPEVMLFSMGVTQPAETPGWVEDRIEDYSRRGFGLWAVVLKPSGEVIGYCGLAPMPDVEGQTQIGLGFRLARTFWARGYATEAATAVRNYAFITLQLPRLIALVDPGNTASIRVLEKIGMVYEKDVTRPGYDHPDRLYAIQRNNEDGHEDKSPYCT